MENKSDELVSFRKDERMVYGVMNYDGNELMAEISGYDLHVAFNLRLIHTLADAENCASALADVFYEALMEQLLATKPDFLQPDGESKPILGKDSESQGGKLTEAHPVLSKGE